MRLYFLPLLVVASQHEHFPTDLYHKFLVDSLEGGSTSNTEVLSDALFSCYQESGRCAAVIGDMFFQGTMPERSLKSAIKKGLPNIVPESKSFQNALQFWWLAAKSGDREALFRLGVFYSAFFNAPAQDRDPALPLSAEPHRMQEGFDRMQATLEVLSLPEGDLRAVKFEEKMVYWWLNKFNHTIDKRCLFGGEKCTARWPLYRRQSLAVLYFYAAAQMGHVGANLALGFRHLYGLGVPLKCQASARYYMRVAASVQEMSSFGLPTAAEMIRLNGPGGEPAGSATHHSAVAALQLHLADARFPQIESSVGKKYLFGVDGLERDIGKAVEHLTSAAKGGDRSAVAYLGYMTTLGLGVQQDFELAKELFISAGSDPMALNGLGFLYFSGTLQSGKDIVQAVDFFNRSAEQGFSDAQYNLGALYLTGEGVPLSYQEAFKLFMKALEQGHSGAAYVMGHLYMNGFGVARDCYSATSLFKRVAEKHPWVAETLKRAYTYQTQRKWTPASFDYWQLGEAGVEVAQSNLAQLLDGGGVRPLKRHISIKSLVERIWTGWLGGFEELSLVKGKPSQKTAQFVRWKATAELLRKVMGAAGLLGKNGLVDSSAIFTPQKLMPSRNAGSEGINHAFAHRYWQLAAMQRSTNAMLRVGDYAWHGWGTEPISERDSNEASISIYKSEELAWLTGDGLPLVSNRDTYWLPLENGKLVDSEGESMEGWAYARLADSPIAKHQVYEFKRTYPNYSLAKAIYLSIASNNPEPPTSKLAEYIGMSRAKAEFTLGLIAYSQVQEDNWDLVKYHMSRVGQQSPPALWASRIALVLLGVMFNIESVYKKYTKRISGTILFRGVVTLGSLLVAYRVLFPFRESASEVTAPLHQLQHLERLQQQLNRLREEERVAQRGSIEDTQGSVQGHGGSNERTKSEVRANLLTAQVERGDGGAKPQMNDRQADHPRWADAEGGHLGGSDLQASRDDGTLVNPAEPQTNQTGNLVNPVANAVTPTEPHTHPTEPHTHPTEPHTHPTEPHTHPTEPQANPAEPQTNPAEPQTNPAEPQTNPAEPQANPAGNLVNHFKNLSQANLSIQ